MHTDLSLSSEGGALCPLARCSQTSRPPARRINVKRHRLSHHFLLNVLHPCQALFEHAQGGILPVNVLRRARPYQGPYAARITIRDDQIFLFHGPCPPPPDCCVIATYHSGAEAYVLIPAARFTRVLPSRCPLSKRAQGKPGAGCAHSAVCERKRKNAHGFDRYSQDNPGFPRAMALRLIRALLGETAFLAPVADGLLHRLSARVAAPGPHDFAVRGVLSSGAGP